MTLLEDAVNAACDELARRTAVKRARAEGRGEATPEAHAAHCPHCEECPYRLGLGAADRPIARLVLERIDSYYIVLGILPAIFVVVAKEAGMKKVTVAGLLMAAFALALSGALRAAKVQKVWPKSIDIFNLVLFGALVAVAFTHAQTLATWLGFIVNAATAAFFCGSVLAKRPYLEDISRDHLPPSRWHLPMHRRAVAAASLAVGVAMLIAALAALVPALACPRARWQHAEEEDECRPWVGVLFDWVLQLVPIVGGIITADVLAHRARTRHAYAALYGFYDSDADRQAEEEAAAKGAAADAGAGAGGKQHAAARTRPV